MKSKKGVELTLNTIIVAILVMIVLVVLVIIFINRATIFNIGISSCENRYSSGTYQCVDDSEECGNVGGRIDISATCSNKQQCCVLNMDTKL